MDVVDEAQEESRPVAYALGRYLASALRPSYGKFVVPDGGVQTDIATLLLQFPFPTIEVDNITLRLIQDDLASVRGRCRRAFLAVDEAARHHVAGAD